MSASDGKGFGPREALERAKAEATSTIARGRNVARDMDAESVKGSIRRVPNALRRALSDSTATGILTKVPAITVTLCLLVTGSSPCTQVFWIAETVSIIQHIVRRRLPSM